MKDPNRLRNQLLYQIFVRQYGKNHNFNDVLIDLPRIKEMGVDIIYLMPIFPCGKVNKKGTFGSPYAIYDYDVIDPFLGGEKELVKLINECHKMGMKIIVDIALNHTSCDARLLQEHEEYYYHKNGLVARKCADWSDVYDLDYNNYDLRCEVTKSLCNLLRLGFDGFRMDVASALPIDFWISATKELEKINDDVIMIAESTEKEFVDYLNTLTKASYDEELCVVFDSLYSYDIKKEYELMKESKLKELPQYLSAVVKQNNYFTKPKLRFLENHDTARIASYNIDKQNVLEALNFFLPGLTFIYAGEEFKISHRPDLFEIDPIDFGAKADDYSKMYKKLSEIRKLDYFYINKFSFELIDDLYILKYEKDNHTLYGLFNFTQKERFSINIPSGSYKELLKDEEISVKNGQINIKDIAIFEV